MNKRIEELKIQACKWASENAPVSEYENAADEKFAKLLVIDTRNKAIEELRQELKLAQWPIGNRVIVEKACEALWQKEPDNRYIGYSK